MQIKSNLQYIQFIASAEFSEQFYGKLEIGITHEDFMLSLMTNTMHLDFKSLNANETAISFAHQRTQNLFVVEANETHWKTTVHYEESNGFLTIHEVMHVLSLEAERLLELKASIIHNNYGKCTFTIFPKKDFFEQAYIYKQGNHGKSFTSEIEYFIEHEY